MDRPTPLHLHRIDPDRNMARFYSLAACHNENCRSDRARQDKFSTWPMVMALLRAKLDATNKGR
jgi:hypothetical protein